MALTDAQQEQMFKAIVAMHTGNWVTPEGFGDLAWLERIVTNVVSSALAAIPAATGGVTQDQIKAAVQAALREGTG